MGLTDRFSSLGDVFLAAIDSEFRSGWTSQDGVRGETAAGKSNRLKNQRLEVERWVSRDAGPRSWEQRTARTWGGCNCGQPGCPG